MQRTGHTGQKQSIVHQGRAGLKSEKEEEWALLGIREEIRQSRTNDAGKVGCKPLLVGTAAVSRSGHTANIGIHARTRTGCNGGIGAQHADTRSKLGSTERHHMLSNVCSNNLAMLGVALSQNPLNQIIAILIAGNVDQGNTGSIDSSLADAVKVATQEIATSDLEALLNHLGSILIRAVLSSITNDVINGAAAVGGGSVLTDMLDAPIAELTVGDDVNIGQDFLDARTLKRVSMNND